MPLYRTCEVKLFGPSLEALPKVSINMSCSACESNQTFTMSNDYWRPGEPSAVAIGRRLLHLSYLCMHCKKAIRHFYVLIDKAENTLMNVGQYPAWDISGNKKLEKRLGVHVNYYRRGLICESQGYGIGAFSYYRRIVEEIIDELLDDISGLLTGEDLAKYSAALEETKRIYVAREKIALVKDLLPAMLRPNGMNPLNTLHSLLSDGMHARSDEECLEDAESCRTVLLFLVGHIADHKDSRKIFTESMQKLLDKRAQKNQEAKTSG